MRRSIMVTWMIALVVGSLLVLLADSQLVMVRHYRSRADRLRGAAAAAGDVSRGVQHDFTRLYGSVTVSQSVQSLDTHARVYCRTLRY